MGEILAGKLLWRTLFESKMQKSEAILNITYRLYMNKSNTKGPQVQITQTLRLWQLASLAPGHVERRHCAKRAANFVGA
jgi:hypothetical protein